jgi:hypothetical protein
MPALSNYLVSPSPGSIADTAAVDELLFSWTLWTKFAAKRMDLVCSGRG